ncbi:hypothetical protein C8Q77DRAFT_705206 [Trametes polyzona]|nr:hypothetical protein C8Q77DRAFT_705206 [Trametes polyzona]
MKSFDAATLPGGVLSTQLADAKFTISPCGKLPAPITIRPSETDLLQKYKQHQRTVREIECQWKFPYPWSNSLGVDTKAIFGPPLVEPEMAHEELEHSEERQSKRRKTEALASLEDAEAVFAPMAQPTVAPPVQPSLGIFRYSPSKPTKKRPLSPEPEPEPESESESEYEAEDDEDDDYAPPEVENAPPVAPPAPTAHKNKQGHKHATEQSETVRCGWGSCSQSIPRACWKKHVIDQHQIKHLGPDVGLRKCRWKGCGETAGSHQSLLRHLKTIHFVAKLYRCHRCGAEFTRGDACKRHLDRRSCRK